MSQISLFTPSYPSATKLNNILLVAPSLLQIQKLNSFQKIPQIQENETLVNLSNSQMQDRLEKEDDSSNISPNQGQKSVPLNRLFEMRRKRKNKEEKNKQIQEKHKDDGRGGNCIASNISKTLLRIIQSTLKRQVFVQFQKYVKMYKVKSQKENTIILLLILFVLGKQGKVNLETLDLVFAAFFDSLQQSEANCQKKMKSEQSRKGFHLKNRKMYTRFIQINKELYGSLKKSLMESSSSSITLKQLEEIISDTYDRKQRDIEKAMNKIKSIILNHSELTQIFGYYENDIEGVFQQAINYAYRRNLLKRCNQVKASVTKIFDQFERCNNIKTEEDRYLICYMTLQLIEDKSKQIWKEFVTNLSMKNQFNQSAEQLNELKTFLQQTIPTSFKDHEELQKKKSSQQQSTCQIQEQTNNCNNLLSLYFTYQQLKNSSQF